MVAMWFQSLSMYSLEFSFSRRRNPRWIRGR
jgi:hypothetical protein